MEQPVDQLNSSSKNDSSIMPVIISVGLTSIIVGGGIFWWMNEKQQELNNEIVSFQNQVDQLKQISSASPTTTNGKNTTTTSQSNFEAYQARQARIAELKTNPQLTVDDIYDLQQVISFLEWKDLFETARKRVVEGSVKGMQFDLVFNWKRENWVHFNVIPENVETDIAQLFLEKVDNRWKAYGPGTAFPDLYEQHPKLSK